MMMVDDYYYYDDDDDDDDWGLPSRSLTAGFPLKSYRFTQ